jgi:hypothetical protein
MSPQLQASFIPKKPLTVGAATVHHTVSVIWFLSIGLFIASVVAAGAVYSYEQFLTNQIKSANESLVKAQAAYDPATIADIIRLDQRITQASNLLKKHIAPSAIFAFLGDTTVPSARFTDFAYVTNISGAPAVQLTGEALDFASVALQSDAFSASHMLNNILFSDINVDSETGHIVFKVTATVNPALVSSP